MTFFGDFLTGSWLISIRALSILSSALFLLALVAIITRVIGGCVCTQVLNKTKCQTHALLVFLAGKSKYDLNYNKNAFSRMQTTRLEKVWAT